MLTRGLCYHRRGFAISTFIITVLVNLLIAAVITAAVMLLSPNAPRSKNEQSPTKSFQLPEVDEAKPVSVIIGTVLVESPAIIAFGDLDSDEIEVD